MGCDQFGEQFQRSDRLGILQARRARVDCAEGTEERSIRQDDWNGDVALEAVHRWRVMPLVDFIFGDMIDDDSFTALPDFVTDGRLDL